jgi:hypothetical protein
MRTKAPGSKVVIAGRVLELAVELADILEAALQDVCVNRCEIVFATYELPCSGWDDVGCGELNSLSVRFGTRNMPRVMPKGSTGSMQCAM